MLFKTVAIVSLIGLAAAAPVAVEPEERAVEERASYPFAQGFCGGPNSYRGNLPKQMQSFCREIPKGEGSRRKDLGGGHSLTIVDSQGGGKEPCWDAYTWVYRNCVVKGKVGQWNYNGNQYKFA